MVTVYGMSDLIGPISLKTDNPYELQLFGDGIEDIEKARTPHYTTRPDLERAGMGLTIMDTLSDGFCISSIVGMGTKLTIRKSLLTIKEDELDAQREAL